MTEHKLKTRSQYWDAVASGEKTFEVRRDDRGFQKGDVLVLENWNPDRGAYVCKPRGDSFHLTDIQTIRKRVTWILTGGQLGIEPGFVVMGLGEPQ